jgi:hypothetical protein
MKMRCGGHVAHIGKMREMHAKFESENVTGGGYLGDLNIHGTIILKWLLKIQLFQDRVQWQALVNTVVNFWVP